MHAIVHAPPISAPEVRMLWERSTYKSGMEDPPVILFMTILKPSNWESMWSLARFHAILGPNLNTTHTHTPLQIYVLYQCKLKVSNLSLELVSYPELCACSSLVPRSSPKAGVVFKATYLITWPGWSCTL